MSEKKMSTMSERWAVEFSGATVLPVASVKVISCYPAGQASACHGELVSSVQYPE